MLHQVAPVIQLTYEPAFDPYHTVFRLLQIYHIFEKAEVLPIEHVRILDFYLVFPFRAEQIRFRSEHRGLRKIAKEAAASKPYGEFPPDRLVLQRMEFAHQAALQTLAGKQMIEMESLERGEVRCTPLGGDHSLISVITAVGRIDSDVIKLVRTLALEYPLMGKGGLKDRTGLLDFKYDVS